MAEYPEQRARKAEQEADAMVEYAYQVTPDPYNRFIMVQSRNQNFAGKNQKPVYGTIRNPYMKVDGKILMARDDHIAQGAHFDVKADYYQVGEAYTCRVTVSSSIHGIRQGHAGVDFKATSGADSTNPLEVAETAALARALRFMGYGVFGSDSDNAYDPMERAERTDDSKPIPNMSGTPEPEPKKPIGEPASEKQLGLLRGLLKSCGVRDGSKGKLIDRIYPDGISKREASDAISLLKDSDKLSGTWINSYIGLLADEEQEDKREVFNWMKENLGTNNPASLTQEQQRELFAWITGDFTKAEEMPAESPQEDPKPEMAIEPTPDNWLLLVTQICQETGAVLNDLRDWAIDRFAPESDYDDISQLGPDAFNQLRGLDLDTIKDNVAQFVERKVTSGTTE